MKQKQIIFVNDYLKLFDRFSLALKIRANQRVTVSKKSVS